jgi:hypothetical protein
MAHPKNSFDFYKSLQIMQEIKKQTARKTSKQQQQSIELSPMQTRSSVVDKTHFRRRQLTLQV